MHDWFRYVSDFALIVFFFIQNTKANDDAAIRTKIRVLTPTAECIIIDSNNRDWKQLPQYSDEPGDVAEATLNITSLSIAPRQDDFIIANAAMQTSRSGTIISNLQSDDFFGSGQPVVSPIDSEVVSTRDGESDHPVGNEYLRTHPIALRYARVSLNAIANDVWSSEVKQWIFREGIFVEGLL